MITFETKGVFGKRRKDKKNFEPVFCKCFYYVSRMLYREKINLDGSINFKHVNLKKHELWSYIYYLYYYNHTRIQVFKNMNKGSTPNAEYFYRQVISTIGIAEPKEPSVSVENLIMFINEIVNEYKTLYNPLLMYLNKIIEKSKMLTLQGITIKTNSNKINVRKSQIQS